MIDSADLTQELRHVWPTGVAWTRLENRLTETVEVAEVVFTPGTWPGRAAPPLRYAVFTVPAALRAHARQLTARKHLRDLRAMLRVGRASRYGSSGFWGLCA